jgi:hypothetical protein
MITIENDAVRIVFNPAGGHFDEVVIRRGGSELRPLHRAPWRGAVGDPASAEVLPDNVTTVERNLAGDFFCAPFCADDIHGGPIHGAPANGEWREEGRETLPGGGLHVTFALQAMVLGARLRKEITLLPGHPLVYQRHVFEGGQGALPLAHHAMLHVPAGAALSFSPKDFGATADTSPEPDPARGRSILAYPQRFSELSAVKLTDGGVGDASRYPFAQDHEDIVFLVERKGARYGWTAALAKQDGFLFFAVKDATVLPQTVLWMSNGGRSYTPWLGRHRAVIGIEEACTFFTAGHRASTLPNALSQSGYRTALDLAPNGVLEIRYAFGAIPPPAGWERIASIDIQGDRLRLQELGGKAAEVPFDGSRV